MSEASTETSRTWVKIDLSSLDQTGEPHDIYMLGYAASSGKIARRDPGTSRIVLGSPTPSDLVVSASEVTISGAEVTLATSATLLVGGQVTFSGGSTATIASIAARVVCANQTGKDTFASYTNPTWTAGANAVFMNPTSVNQGTVANTHSGAQITGIAADAASAADPRVGALVNGYVPPSGKIPTAEAAVHDGAVTGFENLEANAGQYQFAPTVTFPKTGVQVVAEGTCTLDTNGYVSGVTMTKPGKGYETGTTYPAVFSAAPGNTFLFPCDRNGFPGKTAAEDAAALTAISATAGSTTFELSEGTDQPSWGPSSPITLGSAAVDIYVAGANGSGYATYSPLPGKDLKTPNALVSDLHSTGAVKGYDAVLRRGGSSLVVAGAAGSVMVYAVVDYVVTLSADVPAGTKSLTFGCGVAGNVGADGRAFTISSTTYPGIAAALALGQKPQITHGSQVASGSSITALALSGTTITVTLSDPLPAAFFGASVAVALPPTGGNLPVFKWDATTNNAIWAEQLPGGAGDMSVNGSRIYFVLDTLGLGPPAFGYAVGLDAAGEEIVTVTQPADSAVWTGGISPFQYIELTVDALTLGGSGGDGLVYIDLSAVDGFFYPASLSTDGSAGTLLLGQAPSDYTAPDGTAYAAVTRDEILDAWKTTFAASGTFKTDASALRAAYEGLLVSPSSTPIGIQNPTFSYGTPDTSSPAFDSCWDTALDALFKQPSSGPTSIDLQGDLAMDGKPSYYKGSQVTVTGGNATYRAIELAEYKGDYDTATGGSFWVFDPRTPPPSETQAFVPGGSAMAVGYQVFANTGVFASIALVPSGQTPNYAPRTSAPWSSGDALKQLLALQRDIVTAMNRGIGGSGLGTGTAGATTTYWSTETNWYPYAAPFDAGTPQNLFSQWVHTAVIDASAKKFYATYPFGEHTPYGAPVQSAGPSGSGTGPLMNQTYGFGYDETPSGSNVANVPAKFLPIGNTAGSTLSFQLEFGPWSST